MEDEFKSRGPRVLVLLGNAALNGQERGNIEVFYALKDRGVEALFVTHEVWGHHQIQPFLDRLGLRWTTLDYARHFQHGMGVMGWIRNLWRLLLASWGLWRIARRFKPTHIHAANQHYALSVLPALWMMRMPFVYRLGDVPTQHHVLYRILWRWLIIPRVIRFVCVSEYVRSALLETGASPKKARVIYSYPPERPPLTGKSASTETARVTGRSIVFIGQIAPHKGVDLFVKTAIDLCTESNDLRFFVAGALYQRNTFAVGLYAKVKELGLSERIRFLGYVEDVLGLLARADIHVCPSVGEEALSNTVVEAKQAGVPSVVFPSGGLPELVVEQGHDGFVCRARTVEALRKGIDHYLDMDDAALHAAGEAAQVSRGQLGITKETFTRAWLDVYGVA